MSLIPQWIIDVKGWFQQIFNALKWANDARKKIWEYMLNNVWTLIPLVIASMKSAWDFIVTLADRIMTKLDTIDLQALRDSADGTISSALDVVAFCNTFLPIQELFLWCNAWIVLYGICATVRAILTARKLLF
ncbi:hypothetical protein EGM51_03700 [Verrucomicrobia bacterium S94]|nr:hypothetical protein EGM51_03700 [Verrucomicrobia bacterium S94]